MTDREPELEQDRAAAAASWVQDAPVPPPPAGTDRLVLVLESLRGLSAVRRQVRAFLAAGCSCETGTVGDDACDDAVERAVLVIDELTSNALRHGLPPSSLQVADEVHRWVVVVRDGAPGRQPVPAHDRPAGAGGYGLHVIADLTSAHGVQHLADHKLVWACLDKPSHG